MTAVERVFVRETARLKTRAPAVVDLPLPGFGRAADAGWRTVALDAISNRRCARSSGRSK